MPGPKTWEQAVTQARRVAAAKAAAGGEDGERMEVAAVSTNLMRLLS